MRRLAPVLLLLTACHNDYNLWDDPDADAPGSDTDTVVDPDDEVPDEEETDEPEDTDLPDDENPEPVADAGPDQTVKPLDQVTLDGRKSDDPGLNFPLTYKWTLIEKPADSRAIISNPSLAQPTFFADYAGDYVFELTVRNDVGIWDSTPDQVVITAEPSDGFYVQVAWDTESDQDLHIIRSGSRLWDTPGDCNWCNMNPAWGTSSSLDDPSLDWDTIDAYGPETTTIESPANDTYTIAVHYYGQDGDSSCWFDCPETNVTVKLFVDGVEKQSWNRRLDEAGDVWNVATVEWPTERVTTLDNVTTTSETYCR